MSMQHCAAVLMLLPVMESVHYVCVMRSAQLHFHDFLQAESVTDVLVNEHLRECDVLPTMHVKLPHILIDYDICDWTASLGRDNHQDSMPAGYM